MIMYIGWGGKYDDLWPKEWEELGKPNLLENARKRKEEILQNYHPNHISKELDAELRSQFKISL